MERDRRRVLVWSAVLAAGLAAGAWFVGLALLPSLLLGSLVLTAGAVVRNVSDLDDEPSLPPLDESGRNVGARREVTRLSWVMGGPDNRVGEVPHRRVRALAATRLGLRGIDASTPGGERAARELLGPLGHQILVADAGHPPTAREFQACLTLLESLDRGGTPRPMVSSRRLRKWGRRRSPGGPSGPDSSGPDSSGPDSPGPDSSGPDSPGPDSPGPDAPSPDSSRPDRPDSPSLVPGSPVPTPPRRGAIP